jgi:hypothetical protein
MTATKKQSKPTKATRPAVNIIEACRDPKIFKPWFDDEATWAAWFSFLKATFALPLTESELTTFREQTGRTAPRPEGYREATLAIGRRGTITSSWAMLTSTTRSWS